jgi:uncharacterized protein (DUF362 family)
LAPKVAIVKSPRKPNEKQIADAVRKAIELAGGLPSKIGKGDTVIIKPNIVADKPPEAAVDTDTRVCKAIADMLKEKGARPIIAESASVGITSEAAMQASGYFDLQKQGYEVVNLKAKGIELVKVQVPKGKSLKEVDLPKIVVEAKAIIDVPKMKTHDQTLVTLSLKNMKGVLQDSWKRKFHTTIGIMQGVADLNTVVKPDLCVVDGILAMEGLGPVFGTPVEMDLIIAGKDPVAVDAVTSEIMGFAPVDYSIVHVAAMTGVGEDNLKKIEVVGEPIAKVKRKFQTSVEAIEKQIPFPAGFRVILDEKACTGCRNQMLSSLVDMQQAGVLEKAAGWTVLCGKFDKLPDVAQTEKLLLIGACLAKFKDKGVFVQACPPNSSDITRAMGVKGGMGVTGAALGEGKPVE